MGQRKRLKISAFYTFCFNYLYSLSEGFVPVIPKNLFYLFPCSLVPQNP